MNLNPTSAKDKATAIALIRSGASRLIDLDYESASSDVFELGKLGRANDVSVMFRGQEPIIVESPRALRRGLAAQKDTWRCRILLCHFDLASIPTQNIKELWARAVELNDIIVPSNDVENLYHRWAH